MNRRQRHLKPEQRKLQIVGAGVRVAWQVGLHAVTLQQVAREAGCSIALVAHYFPPGELRDAILIRSIEMLERGDIVDAALTVLAQGMTARHPAALAAPEAIRRAAAMRLADNI